MNDKPHIRRNIYGCGWVCSSYCAYGSGETPVAAYKRWDRQHRDRLTLDATRRAIVAGEFKPPEWPFGMKPTPFVPENHRPCTCGFRLVCSDRTCRRDDPAIRSQQR